MDSSEDYYSIDYWGTTAQQKIWDMNENRIIYNLINRKYFIIKKINKGWYSSIWLIYNVINNKFYICKILNDYDENEIWINKYLKLKNAEYNLQIIDYFAVNINDSKDKYICMIFDLYDIWCDDVIEYVKKKNNIEKKIPKWYNWFCNQIKNFLVKTLKLMNKHEIIHMDIKPNNILLK